MQMGVSELCRPTQGDFLAMPFADNTFDAAYAIEATCHASKVRAPTMLPPCRHNIIFASLPSHVFAGEPADSKLLPVQLAEVYSEIRRVLKPGGIFASYEWVATAEFDPNNPEHVRVIDEINFGNGLPVRLLHRPWQTASFAAGSWQLCCLFPHAHLNMAHAMMPPVN